MSAVQHVLHSCQPQPRQCPRRNNMRASPVCSLPAADAAHDDSAPQRRSARAGKGRKRPASSLEEDIDFALDDGEDLDEEPTSRQ